MSGIILSIVGLFSGVCASLGIGGGFVLLLYLTAILGMPQREAQLLNLLFFLPIAIFSLVFHMKNKLISIPAILPAVLSGTVGVFIGIFIANLLSDEWLSKIFALFILLVGIKTIKEGFKKAKATEEY